MVQVRALAKAKVWGSPCGYACKGPQDPLLLEGGYCIEGSPSFHLPVLVSQNLAPGLVSWFVFLALPSHSVGSLEVYRQLAAYLFLQESWKWGRWFQPWPWQP